MHSGAQPLHGEHHLLADLELFSYLDPVSAYSGPYHRDRRYHLCDNPSYSTRPFHPKKIHPKSEMIYLNKFFRTISVGFLTRVTGKKAKIGANFSRKFVSTWLSGKSNGGFSEGGFSNNRFVLKPDVAIASEVSILSKNSLAIITDFHAKKTRHIHYLKTPLPGTPPFAIPKIRKYQSALKERRRRRAEKRLSKRGFLECPFLLCPSKVCPSKHLKGPENLKGAE